MKKIVSFCLAVFSVFALCSCGKTDSDNTKTPEPVSQDIAVSADTDSLSALVAAAAEKITFSETQESQEDSAKFVFGVDGFVSDCYGLCGSSTAEQISVFEVKEGCEADAEEAVRKQISYLAESYASYGPQEVPKLEKAVVKFYGSILVVCVSSDENAEKALDSVFG